MTDGGLPRPEGKGLSLPSHPKPFWIEMSGMERCLAKAHSASEQWATPKLILISAKADKEEGF